MGTSTTVKDEIKKMADETKLVQYRDILVLAERVSE